MSAMSGSLPKPIKSSPKAFKTIAGDIFISSLSLIFLSWVAFEISKSYLLPVFCIECSPFVAMLAWLGRGVLQALTIGLLAFFVSQTAQSLPLSRAWRLRSGFLFAWGVTLLLSMKIWQVSCPDFLAWTLIGFLSSFAGGLAATAKETSLIEENFPPTQALQEEIARAHLRLGSNLPPLPRWKRTFDLGLLLITAPLTIPLGIVLAFVLWLEDPGAVFFVKNSVGRGGRNFRQLKFRTMLPGAEDETGPVLARQDDPRVLWSGKFFRKTALDEIPQLLNILKGEMSFVGPRPQRTVLVQRYLQELPDYAFRHVYPPGLAGLAQVAGDYYLTPLQKLRFDRLYINNASLGLDVRLLFAACLVTFVFRWKKGWKGRLPRWVLHSASRGAALSRRSTKPD